MIWRSAPVNRFLGLAAHTAVGFIITPFAINLIRPIVKLIPAEPVLIIAETAADENRLDAVFERQSVRELPLYQGPGREPLADKPGSLR